VNNVKMSRSRPGHESLSDDDGEDEGEPDSEEDDEDD